VDKNFIVNTIGFAFPLSRLHWWLGLAVLVLGGLTYLLLRLERHRDDRLARFVTLRLAPRLLIGHDPTIRRPLFWLAIIGFGFMAFAFAQPRWGRSWQEVHRQSHDILVLLDTSESMLAENPLPNRLERAKLKINSILDRTPGDRFGLIAFSGAAELMCPLTLDLAYFRSVLNAVDTDSISLEGTDIAAALETAIETYEEQAEETGDYSSDSRAIILISDGEEVSGDAVALASEASKFAHVYVIGVGDPRGTEVAYSNRLGPRAAASTGLGTHFSKLDEGTLQRIAVNGAGGYHRSTPGNTDVEKIYGLIERLASRTVSSDIRFQLVNRYQWPLAVAILCFAGEGLWLIMLPRLRKRRVRAAEARGEEEEYA
jgi:Ca-activated chloride channel family protein